MATKMVTWDISARIGFAVALLFILPTVSRAQSIPPFQGKTITIYISFPPGGGYDSYGRLVARHIGRHVPGNPTVVVSNMPGAQGIACANFMYGVAPRDGTALAVLVQSVAQDQVVGSAGVQYDVSKLNWIGRLAANIETLYVWHTVPVRTFSDLRQHETIIAADGTPVLVLAELLRTTVGGRFKLVKGYRGTPEVNLAMQRGEVEAAVSSISTLRNVFPQWVEKKWINIIVQNSADRQPALPDIPTTVELGNNEQDRGLLAFFAASSAIGRSLVAPPGVPADRINILRAAFDALERDNEFLADIRQSRLDFEPLRGAELQTIGARILNIETSLKGRARAILSRAKN